MPGFELVNVDATVVMERPKLGPARQAMRERLAGVLGIEGAAVNIKASTGEGIGFVGRSEELRRSRSRQSAPQGQARLAELRLYDTRTRAVRTFEPCEPGRVGIYACGPTVYARVHVGNARPFVVFLLMRLLEHEGYAATLVINVTDVNDKIYAAAAPPGSTAPRSRAR